MAMTALLGTNKPADEPVWPVNDYYKYGFLHTELNTLQFYDRGAIEPFFRKLQQTGEKKVSVLYIGDSHVQADDFTAEIRNRMQQRFGYGGRGMVFPFSTARTHAAVDYTTEHTGRWLYSKNVEAYPELPMGVSGATSRTYDSTASFKLHFRGTIRPEFSRLRIFCKRGPQSYDVVVKSGLVETRVDIWDPAAPTDVQVIDVDIPRGENDLGFYLRKNDSLQREFEIYGISIETPEDKGMLFHSVGINGAGHYSLLRQQLMEDQLRLLKPDVIVLDVGANDFYRGGLNKTDFTNNLGKITANIRRALPEVNIILSCSQDIYRGGYSLPDCAIFSAVIKDFARENKCAFYDWYWIAGGRYSMLKWNSSLLSKWDLVHLTHNGYVLKGQLITEAMQRTYDWFNNSDTAVSLVYNIDTLLNPPIDTTRKAVAVQPAVRYQWVYHRVLRGQTIWSVAAWYGVSAYQIRVWNNLRSNYLWIGQVLKIYAPVKTQAAPPVNQPPKQEVTPTPAPKPPQQAPKPPVKQAPRPTAVYHKVKSGETLFAIARRYGTSTSAIMRLNNLRTHTIRPGQVLRVK